MNNIKGYVTARGMFILWRFLVWYGASSDTRSQVMGAFAGVMSGWLGIYLSYPLAMLVFIYDVLANVNIDLPQWVTTLYNFVWQNIRPYWNWVVNSLQTIIGIINSLGNTISNYVLYYLNALLSTWYAVLNFARWLLVNFQSLLHQFLSDPVGFIVKIINNVLHDALSWLGSLREIWNALIKPFLSILSTFLQDPKGFVINIIRNFIPALFELYNDLVAFFQWWRNKGMSYLVALTNDPVGFILSLIRDKFIDWLSNLIADEL